MKCVTEASNKWRKPMLKNVIATLTLAGVLAATSNAGLVITGVFDGPLSGGTPKVIELYSHGDTDLDMWATGSANNGGGTDGPESLLTGFAADGTFVYVTSDAVQLNTYFGSQIPAGSPIFVDGGANINGDDAIELFKFDQLDDMCVPVGGTESVIDTLGEIDVDGTGTAWDHLDGWAYRNAGTGPDGAAFTIGSWAFSGINANDGEVDNATATTPFPIGSYTNSEMPVHEVDCVPVPEPSALALLLIGGFAFLRRR